MTKFTFSAVAVALATLVNLPVVCAQQGTPNTPPQSQVYGVNGNADAQSRSQTGQQGRYEARRVTTDSQMNQGPTVKEALVQKLMKANEAEIELAKIAQQKTNNGEVKQLASQIVNDHQKLNRQLQQISSKQSNHSGNTQSPTVPQQLCDIADRACENAMQMTKEMFDNYDGQDFNMAFLGQQAVAHTMMIAELKAIESTGPETLQPFASQAVSKQQKHLEKVKRLAEKLEKDGQSRS